MDTSIPLVSGIVTHGFMASPGGHIGPPREYPSTGDTEIYAHPETEKAPVFGGLSEKHTRPADPRWLI
jgi:hypothetical protein